MTRTLLPVCLPISLAFFLTTVPLSAAPAKPASPITIITTGDRYIPSYRITVDVDGQLSAVTFPRNPAHQLRRTNKLIPANRKRLFSDLAKAEPIRALPSGRNLAALRGRRQGRIAPTGPSGMRVYVQYGGQQSPDLRQASSAAGQKLYQDVRQIMAVLGMPVPNTP
jgi:hypothetical protein